jgi:hypothetical protein
LDRAAWQEGGRILELDEQLDAAIDWWLAMSTHLALNLDEMHKIAQLHARLFRSHEALRILAEIDTDLVAQDAAHWAWVAELAWAEGDLDQVNAALRSYAQIQPLDQHQLNRLIATLNDNQRDLRLSYAQTAWARFSDPQMLLLALNDAFITGDNELLSRLFLLANAQAAKFTANPNFWLIKAQHHQRTKEHKQAWNAYAHADSLAPTNPNVAAGLLWFLIDTQDKHQLIRYLAIKHSLAKKEVELAPVYGAAFAFLGQSRQASRWYGRALHNHPGEPRIALAYADTLLALGAVDAGLRMRQHALRQVLSGQQALAPEDLVLLRSASATLLSLPQFNRAVTSLAQQGSTSRFNLALQNLRTEAAQQTIEARREAIVATVASQPYGVQTQTASSDLGGVDLNKHSLRFVRPFGASGVSGVSGVMLLDARLEQRDYDPRQALGTSGSSSTFTETALHLALKRPLDNGEWSFTTTAVASEFDNWVGLRGTRRWIIDSNTQIDVFAAHRNLTEQTPLLQIFGRVDQLGISSDLHISPRENLNLALRLNRFADRFGADIGRGFELESNFTQSLFATAPQLHLTASGYWMRNRRDNLGSELIAQLNGRIANDLLPTQSARLGVGVVVERGETPRLSGALPPLHYKLAINTGYQWPTRNPTLNIAASLGVRVFKNDLLMLNYLYESQPQAVEAAAGGTWSLVYSRGLGARP